MCSIVFNLVESNKVQFSLYSVFVLLSECHEWSAAPISAFLRRGPRSCLRSECCTGGESMEAASRVNWLPCTHQSTLSTRLDRPQVPILVGKELDSRSGHAGDFKNDICGLSNFVLGVDEWVQEQFPRGAGTDSTPAVQYSLRKQPRGPRRKQVEMVAVDHL